MHSVVRVNSMPSTYANDPTVAASANTLVDGVRGGGNPRGKTTSPSVVNRGGEALEMAVQLEEGDLRAIGVSRVLVHSRFMILHPMRGRCT